MNNSVSLAPIKEFNSTSPAPTKELSLLVEGMTCASCVGRVEKALLKVSGVSVASVNLATEKATVTALATVSFAALAKSRCARWPRCSGP